MSSWYRKIMHSTCSGSISRRKGEELNSATVQFAVLKANFDVFYWLVPYRGFKRSWQLVEPVPVFSVTKSRVERGG